MAMLNRVANDAKCSQDCDKRTLLDAQEKAKRLDSMKALLKVVGC